MGAKNREVGGYMLTIRNATPSDADAAFAVEEASFPAGERAKRAVWDARILTFPETFFIAVLDGKTVGHINGCATNEVRFSDALYASVAAHDPNGRYQAVCGLAVLPEYRGRRIAARLLEAMKTAALKSGRSGIILACKSELEYYYSQFGYIRLGESESDLGGETWSDMLLPL